LLYIRQFQIESSGEIINDYYVMPGTWKGTVYDIINPETALRESKIYELNEQ